MEPNKFFVYEGEILRAAQSKLDNALKYLKTGFRLEMGTPDVHAPVTVLQIASYLLGWQGGTIHQVKEEILKMSVMDRGIFLNKLYAAIKHDDNLFRFYMAEYAPLRIVHLEIKTL